jgi:hypothetical protein
MMDCKAKPATIPTAAHICRRNIKKYGYRATQESSMAAAVHFAMYSCNMPRTTLMTTQIS